MACIVRMAASHQAKYGWRDFVGEAGERGDRGARTVHVAERQRVGDRPAVADHRELAVVALVGEGDHLLRRGEALLDVVGSGDARRLRLLSA